MTASEYLNSIGIYSLDTKKRWNEVIGWMEAYASKGGVVGKDIEIKEFVLKIISNYEEYILDKVSPLTIKEYVGHLPVKFFNLPSTEQPEPDKAIEQRLSALEKNIDPMTKVYKSTPIGAGKDELIEALKLGVMNIGYVNAIGGKGLREHDLMKEFLDVAQSALENNKPKQ